MDSLINLGYEIGDINLNKSYLEIELPENNLDMRMVKQDFRRHIEELLIFFEKEHLYDGIQVHYKDNTVKIKAKRQFLETYIGFL